MTGVIFVITVVVRWDFIDFIHLVYPIKFDYKIKPNVYVFPNKIRFIISRFCLVFMLVTIGIARMLYNYNNLKLHIFYQFTMRHDDFTL